MGADIERVRNEISKIYGNHITYSVDCSYDLHFYMGVLDLNEVITREMVEDGYVPEVIFDKLEEYKTAIEWMETFKYLFKQFCEENGVKSWETEYFKMTYIGDCQAERIDTKRMRETNIFVMNGESGEVEEVNAYKFFLKDCVINAHVTYKEKK